MQKKHKIVEKKWVIILMEHLLEILKNYEETD